MPIMPAQIAINNEVQGWVTANPQLAQSNYVIKKLESKYTRNYDVKQSGDSGALTALKALELYTNTVTPDNVQIRAYLKETQVIAPQVNATLNNASRLGLIMATGSNVKFEKLSMNNFIELTQFGPGTLPAATVGDFIRVRHRPNTVGVATIAAQATGTDATLQAQVSENTVVPTHTGGTLALADGVEWPIAQGTQAHLTYNTLTSSAVLMQVVSAMFAGLVNVGDYVELTVRTTAPVTANPTLVGYYKVTGVGNTSLLLDRKRYTRTSEGVFVQDPANLPNIADDMDWRVFRTAQNALYLRQTGVPFTTVAAGDYVRATDGITSWVFKATSSPATGLLLLDPMRYSGASAPYTALTNVTANFSATVTYSVTRAPSPQMAVFRITAATNFVLAGVQPGHFVLLTNRPGPLDPTTFPAQTLHYFKVLSVATSTLTLDNERYVLSGSVLVPQGVYTYGTFVDNADYSVFKSTVSYPYSRDPSTAGATSFQPLLYQVVATTPTLRVSEVRQAGYDEVNRELSTYTVNPTAAPFVDYFDIDVIRDFGDRLYLKSASGSFPGAVTGNANTYAVVTAHTSGATPYTSPPRQSVVTGAFNVLSKPLPDILFVARTKYAGRAIDGPGSQFAPYLVSAAPAVPVGSWHEPVDFKVMEQDTTEYDKVVITGATGTLVDVNALDFLLPTNITVAVGHPMNGAAILLGVLGRYFEVTTKINNQLLSVGNNRRGSTSFADPVSKIDLDFSTFLDPLACSSFAANIDTFQFLRSATATTFAQLVGVVPEVGVAVGDFAKVTYADTPTPTTKVFRISALGPTVIDLNPVVVTGSDGVYTVTATPLALDIRASAIQSLEIQRPTGALSQVTDYLSAFTTYLPSGLKTAMDQGLTKLYNDAFDVGGLQYSPANKTALLTAAMNAVQQISAYLPDQEFLVRGFGEGSLFSTATPSTLTPSGLSVYDVTQTPEARANGVYQDMLAVALPAQFGAVLQKQQLVDMKNAYVDARLQELGYTAELANVSATEHAARFELSCRLFFVQKLKESAVAALTTCGRLDIKTSADTTMTNILALVNATIPSGMFTADKHAYFVRSGPPVDFSVPFAVYLVTNPTFVSGLNSSNAQDRRRALQNLINAPVEPTLRVKRRNYARIRARQRARLASKQDLLNHISQTTDPQALAGLQAASLQTDQAIAADAGQQATLHADLMNRAGSVPGIIGPPQASAPTDLQAQNSAASAEVGGPDGATEGAFASANVPSPLATGLTVTGNPTAPSLISTAPSPVAGVAVTYLFGNDVVDYRVVPAIIPYYSLNAAHNNASNFATITLCDFNLENKGKTPITIDPYGTVSVHNGQYLYNQFKLVSLQEVHAEKFQIVDTLAENFLTFSFGARPEVWSLSGTLINDIASDQLGKFRLFYEQYIRLSALERRRKKMVLKVPAMGIEIYGYAVSFAPAANSEGVQTVVPFTLQFVVTNVATIPMITKITSDKTVPISSLIKYLHKNSGLTTGGGVKPATTKTAATTSPGDVVKTAVDNVLAGGAEAVNEVKSSITSTLAQLTDPSLFGFGLG